MMDLLLVGPNIYIHLTPLQSILYTILPLLITSISSDSIPFDWFVIIQWYVIQFQI